MGREGVIINWCIIVEKLSRKQVNKNPCELKHKNKVQKG